MMLLAEKARDRRRKDTDDANTNDHQRDCDHSAFARFWSHVAIADRRDGDKRPPQGVV